MGKFIRKWVPFDLSTNIPKYWLDSPEVIFLFFGLEWKLFTLNFGSGFSYY